MKLPVIFAVAALTLAACYGGTESAEKVTTTSATLTGWGVPQTTATDAYFEYSTTDVFTSPKKSQEIHPTGLTVGQTYPIAIDVTGLSPDTRYWYRLCGKEQTETTYNCAPSVRSFITSTFTNPVATGADIKVVQIGSSFYASGTGCALLKSADGTSWSKIADICGEVTKVGAQWVAVSGADTTIRVATATVPTGPWTWHDEAVVTDAADPSIFADPSTGKAWLTWTRQNELVAQELDPADVTRVRPGSQPVVLLSTDVQPQDREQAYGRRVIEGQDVFVYAGKYYLHYGAGNSTYDTAGGGQPYTFNITDGLDSFPGRFTKRAEPTLRGGNGWRHPGHGSVFVDGGGNPWAAVSLWKDGDSQNRHVFLQKMTFSQGFSIYNGVVNTGQIGVPVPYALSLELQQILGPQSGAEFPTWLQAMHDWRGAERTRIGYSPANYERPELAWAQRNPIQPQVMVEDRYLYDVSTRRYTVARFLADVRSRYGGVDSVLIWPTYPNIGADDRNTREMLLDMPGGLDGVRQLVRDFHAQGVKVLFVTESWENGTHDPGAPWEQVLPPLMAELEADGLNGDIMHAVPKAYFDNSVTAGRPLVLEPELGLGSADARKGLPWNLQSWGYWNTSADVPMVSIAKWLEPRHTVHVNNRWSSSKIDMLQAAFFNGTGLESWENVWGIWNQVTDRDGEAIRRVAAIERQFPELLVSQDWEPHTPTLQAKVFASKWPVGSRTLWTLVNRDTADTTGAQLKVAPGLRYFDVWNGVELQPSADGTLAFPIEGKGFGAVLATPGENLDAFLAQMRQWAAKPLRDFSDVRKELTQVMTPIAPTQRYATAPSGMVRIPGAQFPFNVRGTEVEGGFGPPMNVQYPWERRADRHHSQTLAVPAFYLDRTPVTNQQYKLFLTATGYRPPDTHNFLKHWDWSNAADPVYRAGAANRPVTWVSIEDARAYAQWSGRRLPHGWEWQYAAQGLDGRPYPWGDTFDATRVPQTYSDRGTLPPPAEVEAHPTGASPFGVLDLVGNVWQWTDEFTDERTRSAIVRGGSYYRASGSDWYFPSDQTDYRLDHHNKYLLMAPGRDRAATIGFRTAADSTEAPPAAVTSGEIVDAHAPANWWHPWKSAGWQHIEAPDAMGYNLIGGTAGWAERPFYGTGVEVFGPRRPDGGAVRILVDGQPIGQPVSLFAPVTKHNQLYAKVTGLANGKHTIRIEREAGAWTGLDYLRVHAPLEAEQLPITGGKPYTIQTDCCGVQWSQGKQVWFQATAPGDTYTLTFDVATAGNYNVTLIYTKAPDFGIQTRTLDGRELGKALDHHLPGGVGLHRETYIWQQLAAGQHQLTFTVTGKDPASPRYGFGLDAIVLDPVS